jgi:hypothetical protein
MEGGLGHVIGWAGQTRPKVAAGGREFTWAGYASGPVDAQWRALDAAKAAGWDPVGRPYGPGESWDPGAEPLDVDFEKDGRPFDFDAHPWPYPREGDWKVTLRRRAARAGRRADAGSKRALMDAHMEGAHSWPNRASDDCPACRAAAALDAEEAEYERATGRAWSEGGRVAANEVARTIIQQIGQGALMNLGARDFVADADGVIFRIGPGSVLRKVVVRLNPMDTYDVEIWEGGRGADLNPKRVYEAGGVYFDQLAEVLIRAHDQVSAPHGYARRGRAGAAYVNIADPENIPPGERGTEQITLERTTEREGRAIGIGKDAVGNDVAFLLAQEHGLTALPLLGAFGDVTIDVEKWRVITRRSPSGQTLPRHGMTGAGQSFDPLNPGGGSEPHAFEGPYGGKCRICGGDLYALAHEGISWDGGGPAGPELHPFWTSGIEKDARRRYTPAERAALIEENGRASNAHKLDLEGTHYRDLDEDLLLVMPLFSL